MKYFDLFFIIKAKYYKICIIILFINNIGFAQNTYIKTYLDTNTIEIAEQIYLNFDIISKTNQKIKFPEFKDEIIDEIILIEEYSLDTLTDKNHTVYRKKYLITSFTDSLYILPSIKIKVDNINYYTDSLLLKVTPLRVDSSFMSKLDTTKAVQIFDIKEPVSAPWTFSEFWQQFGDYILLGLLIAIIVTFSVIYIIKKRQNKPIIKIEKPKEPAYNIALKNLQKLKEKKLWQQEKTKEYYTELTQILRVYIEDQFFIPALEQTSIEIIESLNIQQNKFNIEDIKTLKNILFIADLVKFAKSKPLPNENEMFLKHAVEFVENSKPDEDTDNEHNNVKKTEEVNKKNQEENQIIEKNI